MGRELGEYALETFVFTVFFGEGLIMVLFFFRYTQVKAVHINLGQKM
jgi:hypothetical protein